LIRVLQVTTAREVAARCRVSPAAVSRWVAGFTAPNAAAKATLRVTYGIREEAWSEREKRYPL
jgi:transcriptional regulator with XRE-family HTH domain